MKQFLRFVLVAALVLTCHLAYSQFSPAPAPLAASTVPTTQLIQVQELKTLLSSSAPDKPLVLQVGSHVFFAQAHIPGSQYAGPGSQPAGLAVLEKTVSTVPKSKFIILYCGCCPWNRCPNVGPAFKRLHDLGFTNVKVLYMPSNFGDDWVDKGYPVEK